MLMLKNNRAFHLLALLCIALGLLISCGGDESSSGTASETSSNAESDVGGSNNPIDTGDPQTDAGGQTDVEPQDSGDHVDTPDDDVMCVTGNDGCPCFGNQTCLDDLRCSNDMCEPCPQGEQGCACGENETCDDTLICMEGLCAVQTCALGELGCPCNEEEACDEGLTCSDGGMCAPCAPDIENCPCDEDSACGPGLACDDNDLCALCPDDEEGCPCNAEGVCGEELICDEDDALCRAPLSCDALPCVANQLCSAASGMDAACLEQCADGFIYNNGTGQCDPAQGQANCRMDDPQSILPECGLRNRRCIEMGGEAECGGCLDNFLDDGGTLSTCRAAVTCMDLGCDTLQRACMPHTQDRNAVCDGCLEGFEERNAVCEPLPVANCDANAPDSILAQCMAENRMCMTQGSNARCGECFDGFAVEPETELCVQRLCSDLDCAERGRACDGDPLAQCGECRDGLIPLDPNDANSDCRASLTCLDLNCEEGDFCVERSDADAVCSQWPCVGVNGEPDFNQAMREETGACIDCGIVCGVEGETGRLWPFTLENSNRCICETDENFYLDPGGNFTARPCDSDGDGWVRSSARSTLESSDSTLLANARCDLRSIDRFVLENEFQQRQEVLSCTAGFVAQTPCLEDGDCEIGRCLLPEPNDERPGTCGCVEALPIDLYEPVRNDDQDELDEEDDNDIPLYANAGNGRRLRASELNPLTRACISVTGDHNDNGVRDIVEWQGQQPGGADGATIAMMQFSYFVELHEGSYQHTLGDAYGRYHIREKSRCAEDFPIQYNGTIDGNYWRQCTRNRDADFNRLVESPRIGYEFAEWSCPQGAETCDVPPPPTHMTSDGIDIPTHGLCEEGLQLPPVDGVWRGMNHHSQFKCVQVVETLPDDRDTEAPHMKLAAELTDGAGQGLYQMNACRAACPEDDPDCISDCDGNECIASAFSREDDTDLPVIQCQPVTRNTVQTDQVGFVAVRYTDAPGLYTQGCINEFQPAIASELAEPWKLMCPGYANNPRAVVGQGNPGNFGKLACGCGFNYGGSDCSQGCAGELVHYGGDGEGPDCANGYCPVSGNGGGRVGFWMCGSWSSIGYDNGLPSLSHEEDGWNLTGDIPTNGVERTLICEEGACGTGFSVR